MASAVSERFSRESYAIYGYCKDKRNKNRLVVDEYAADIVRSIYRRKLEGMSAQAIAEQLNSENVLAPSEYKRLCGLNYHSGFKAGTHAKWQAIQVLRILKNEIYTGTMVQGRRQKINYKIKKIRDVEESGWIRVPNMHEAIIPQKLFDTVQEVLKLDTCASKGQRTVNLFSGIVRCGGCGQNMVRRTKNNGNRCSAYVPEHHEAIVSPEIARAAHLVASSRKKCGVQDIVVIQQGTLKGFVGIHPNWSGISVESIRSLCLSTYLPEEVMKLNDIAEMRAGATLGTALQSEYMTVSGACFINQSSPVMTISKNGIRFSKACHSRLDDCEYVELLYHPILQVVILRKSNHGFSTTMRWRDDNDVHSAFSARAFSGLVFQTLNWRRNCRYQCRGICRGQGNAKFLIFELDESRILTGKNQYEQENCSMNLKCRLYRSKWVQSITVSDVMESGQVVENPMIGAIPSRNEVQRELDDLLMSM